MDPSCRPKNAGGTWTPPLRASPVEGAAAVAAAWAELGAVSEQSAASAARATRATRARYRRPVAVEGRAGSEIAAAGGVRTEVCPAFSPRMPPDGCGPALRPGRDSGAVVHRDPTPLSDHHGN